jgi:hypothetical protein
MKTSKMIFWNAVIATATIMGCVHTHMGKPVTDSDWGMTISCDEDTDVDDKHFFVVACTLENQSESWKRVTFKDIHFVDKAVVRSTPEEVHAFAEAYEFKAKQMEHNTSLALGAIMLGGLAIAAGSNNPGLAGAGFAAAAGGALYESGRAIRRDVNDATYPEIVYAKNHILGEKVEVPPGLFVRKLAVFQRLEKNFNPTELELCDEKRCVTVPFEFWGSVHRRGPGA